MPIISNLFISRKMSTFHRFTLICQTVRENADTAIRRHNCWFLLSGFRFWVVSIIEISADRVDWIIAVCHNRFVT